MSAPSPTRPICHPTLVLLRAPRGRTLWTTPPGYWHPGISYRELRRMWARRRVRSESRCWGLPPGGPALLAQVSHDFSLPSPHQPQCHGLESCTIPMVTLEPGHTSQSPFHWTFLKFPSFEYVLSFCQELIASLSKSSVCSDTNISATLLLKLTLKQTVKSKLLQAVWKFFP